MFFCYIIEHNNAVAYIHVCIIKKLQYNVNSQRCMMVFFFIDQNNYNMVNINKKMWNTVCSL